MLGSGDLFTPQACLDMIALHRRRRRDGRPRRDRQSVDLRSRPARWPPACRCPTPPTLHEQRDVIAEHYRLAEELYGAERCLPDMRKFGIKYSQLHPQHTRSARRLLRA